MNKLEYLRTLENALHTRLNQREVNDVIRDYAEYFAEGARQGKTDEEMAANLGDPIEVARQVIAESQEVNAPAGPASEKKDKNIVVKIALIALGMCLLPVFIGAALCLVGGAAAAVACLFGAVALCGCGVVLGLAALVVSLMYIGVLPVTAVVLCCLGGVGLVALGVLGLCLSIWVIRAIWRGLCWCGKKLYSVVFKKPWPEKAPKSASPAPGWQPEPQSWEPEQPAQPEEQPIEPEWQPMEPEAQETEEEEGEQND